MSMTPYLERGGWLRVERGKLGRPDRINLYQLSEQFMAQVRVEGKGV